MKETEITKMHLWMEVATDILHKVHTYLCHERKLDEAEETMEIMRRMILLWEKI